MNKKYIRAGTWVTWVDHPKKSKLVFGLVATSWRNYVKQKEFFIYWFNEAGKMYRGEDVASPNCLKIIQPPTFAGNWHLIRMGGIRCHHGNPAPQPILIYMMDDSDKVYVGNILLNKEAAGLMINLL